MVIIKNHQYIRGLSVKELAELLVSTTEINEPDEGMDGEMYDYYVTYFVCPDGIRCYDFDDAVAHTIDWLNSDMKRTDEMIDCLWEGSEIIISDKYLEIHDSTYSDNVICLCEQNISSDEDIDFFYMNNEKKINLTYDIRHYKYLDKPSKQSSLNKWLWQDYKMYAKDAIELIPIIKSNKIYNELLNGNISEWVIKMIIESKLERS